MEAANFLLGRVMGGLNPHNAPPPWIRHWGRGWLHVKCYV